MNFSFYHLTGSASALFVVLALGGLFAQAKFIHTRHKKFRCGALAEQPTAVLSLNRFFAAYFGFYAMFSYGLFLQPLNYYLVAPRILAAFVLLYILYAILRDRRNINAAVTFFGAVLLLVLVVTIRAVDLVELEYSAQVAQVLIVAAAVIFLQGAIHQLLEIRRARHTGGLSLFMHQMFFAKDFFSCWFGVTMGLQLGWPLLLFNGVSLVMQAVIVWHFRWCKIQRNKKLQPSVA